MFDLLYFVIEKLLSGDVMFVGVCNVGVFEEVFDEMFELYVFIGCGG